MRSQSLLCGRRAICHASRSVLYSCIHCTCTSPCTAIQLSNSHSKVWSILSFCSCMAWIMELVNLKTALSSDCSGHCQVKGPLVVLVSLSWTPNLHFRGILELLDYHSFASSLGSYLCSSLKMWHLNPQFQKEQAFWHWQIHSHCCLWYSSLHLVLAASPSSL